MKKFMFALGWAAMLSFSPVTLMSCGGELVVPGGSSSNDPAGDSGPSTGGGSDGGTVIGGDTDPSGGDTDSGNGDSNDPPSGGDADTGTGDTTPEDSNGDGCTDDLVAVCHVPDGNPDDAHVICVGESAAEALLEHGDTLGACPDIDPGEEPEPVEKPSEEGPGEDPEPDPEPVEEPSEEGPGNGSGSCGSGRVEICHTPNGNGSNARTLCVGEPASGAHLDHNDTLGACPE